MVRSPASPIPGSYKGALFLMWARPIPSKARQRCTAHRQIAAPHTTARMQLLAPHATARTGRSRLLTQQHACLAQAVLSLPFLPFATAQHACSGQGASITHARTHICTQAHTHTDTHKLEQPASHSHTHANSTHIHPKVRTCTMALLPGWGDSRRLPKPGPAAAEPVAPPPSADAHAPCAGSRPLDSGACALGPGASGAEEARRCGRRLLYTWPWGWLCPCVLEAGGGPLQAGPAAAS